MPPKSKQSVSEWNQCVKCNVTVSSRLLSKHREECDANKTLTHGHIVQNIFYGVVSPYPEDDKIGLPSQLKKNLILLNPSVMQLCGFYIGGFCIVNKTIKTCWPCSSVSPTNVALLEQVLTEEELQLGQLVSVQPFIDTSQCAEEITVLSKENNPMFSDDKFLQYLRRSFEGQYVCEGCKLHVNYYGQKFSFQLTAIQCQTFSRKLFQIVNDPASLSCDQDVSISNSLANISLNDSVLTDTDCVHTDSFRANNITSTPCSKSSSVDQSGNKSLTLDQSGAKSKTLDQSGSNESNNVTVDQSKSREEHAFTERLKTPVRDKENSVSLSSPRTPANDFTVNRDQFCTPKIVRSNKHENISQIFYKVTSETKVMIRTLTENVTDVKRDMVGRASVKYSDIGGLSKQIEMLKEMLHTPIEQPHLFQSFGLPPPSGILLFGPSGCGKTMLLKAVMSELPLHVVSVAGAEIWSKFYGETEAKLRAVFDEARQHAPSLIVIDEVETLCPRRDASNSEVEKRVVSSLLTLMDGINNTKRDKFVIVLGTTSKPDQIDPALRRPGRFDREIEIGIPTALDRRQILKCMLANLSHQLTEGEIIQVADAAHGYVGADLSVLCKEASLHCMKWHSGSPSLTVRDFKHAMEMVQPSAMREVQIEVPKVLWSDIGGQEQVKLKLQQAVEWPLKHPEAFTRMGISPPKGILMYGPPGCSKTMVAKALATESGLNFLAVKFIRK